jgi:RNA polymerase sigma-70 factor (ECF subfamily)
VCTCCCDQIADLARAHARRLAAVARREGASAADALDLVQDAFVTLLARSVPPADPARTLTAIVRNAARNLRRRHFHARPHVELGDAALTTPEPAPDAAAHDGQTTERLAGCMAGLAEVQRHVITLRVLEELSSDEAARELGLTANHVGVLLHRARKQLARCMADG